MMNHIWSTNDTISKYGDGSVYTQCALNIGDPLSFGIAVFLVDGAACNSPCCPFVCDDCDAHVRSVAVCIAKSVSSVMYDALAQFPGDMNARERSIMKSPFRNILAATSSAIHTAWMDGSVKSLLLPWNPTTALPLASAVKTANGGVVYVFRDPGAPAAPRVPGRARSSAPQDADTVQDTAPRPTPDICCRAVTLVAACVFSVTLAIGLQVIFQ